MSREIKFRAWMPNLKSMYQGHSVSISIGGAVHYLHTSGEWECDIDENTGDRAGNVVLMQYTGLKDKNGKEIYEGDIIPMKIGVQEYAYWQVDDPNASLNGFISWDIYQLCWHILFPQNKYGLVSARFGYGGFPEIEVIGNIYEYKELISN